MEYSNVLLKSSLFQGINKVGMQDIIHCLNPVIRNYEKSSFITLAGDAFNSIGVILTGEVVVLKESGAGNRTVMALLKPGDIFGEVVAFSRKATWPASIQAQEFSQVLFLSGEKIIGGCESICPWHRTLIRNTLGIISEKALMLNKRVDYLSIKSMREKICTYLLDQVRETGKLSFVLPLKRQELADYLNVSRPSMSREMGRMRDEGIIDYHRSSVTVNNLEALKSSVK